jgi:predicted nuclease of restriction endonuclease-like (RecB) superfamily
MAGKKERAVIKTGPTSERKQRGRVDRSVMFPVPPTAGDVPVDYAAWLADLKARIHQERLRVVLASNAVMVLLYWDIGRSILDKQADQGWGSRVIDRLAADLRDAFLEMKGFSPRNLKYMRAFAAAWPDRKIVQASLAQLTWYHHIALLEKLDSPESRLWYAAKTLEHGWSRNMLAVQIDTQALRRHGKAQTNFPATLPPLDSDMAVQVFKDPYLFDFLGTDGRVAKPSWNKAWWRISRSSCSNSARALPLSDGRCIWKSATRTSISIYSSTTSNYAGM